MHSVAATINWEKMRFISWEIINRPYQSIIVMSLSHLLLSFEELQIRKYTAQRMV